MGRNLFRILLIFGVLTLGIPSFVGAQNHKNTFCPVMPGTPVKEKFFVDYQGKRVYLCCASCIRAFKKRPEKYLKRLAEPPPSSND